MMSIGVLGSILGRSFETKVKEVSFYNNLPLMLKIVVYQTWISRFLWYTEKPYPIRNHRNLTGNCRLKLAICVGQRTTTKCRWNMFKFHEEHLPLHIKREQASLMANDSKLNFPRKWPESLRRHPNLGIKRLNKTNQTTMQQIPHLVFLHIHNFSLFVSSCF